MTILSRLFNRNGGAELTACQLVIWVLALGLAGFHIWTALYGVAAPYRQRGIHLVVILLLGFLSTMPSSKPGGALGRTVTLSFFFLTLGVGACLLAWTDPSNVLQRGIRGPSSSDLLIGVVLLCLILEGTRRAVGMPIVIVALLFLAYGYFGPQMPDIIAHRGYTIERLTTYLVWSTEGVFGTPLAVTATFVIIFIIFGSLMNALGAGQFFIDFAISFTGRLRGGPALTAVAGSALMGSINGSSVSNVVTTGTFTIPLMRRTGYRPEFAAGVEAVASTGGQIMPPVMGAGAFVMAELLGISYTDVARMALLPALLYFASVGLMVYFEARRENIDRIPSSELPRTRDVVAGGGHLLLPLLLLVYLLIFAGYSPMVAGTYAMIALILVAGGAIVIRERRLPWFEVLDGLKTGVVTAIPVALACASAGIVIGIVSLTGLGVRFTQLIVELSAGMLWLGAIMTMVACIILGMGLPTTAAYIITAVLGAPALVQFGVPLMSAHMFIFYFAIVSFITPPVGLSSYAAAGIAGTNPMRTSLVAFKLGAAGFIVPYIMLYSPAVLLIGSLVDIFIVALTSFFGILALAASLVGWFMRPLGIVARSILFGSAILLIAPNPFLGMLGVIPIIILAVSVPLSIRRRDASNIKAGQP